MKILFSITHYKLLDVFKNCLRSLKISANYAKKNYEDFNYQILVIGNSIIKDEDIIKDKEIKLIQNCTNFGFTKSCNQAFDYSLINNFDETVLINQDILFQEDTILKILQARKTIKNKNTILSPLQMDENLKYDFKSKKNLIRMFDKNENILEVDFVNAACWFISNNVIKKLGAMNEVFNHFGSDDEYVYRLKKISGKIYIIYDAKIIHLRSFYKKNFDKKYSDMQMISSIIATAYLKIIIEKRLFNAFVLLILKPFVFLMIRKISLKNFFEIIKYKNIKTLIRLYRDKNNLFIKINE